MSEVRRGGRSPFGMSPGCQALAAVRRGSWLRILYGSRVGTILAGTVATCLTLVATAALAAGPPAFGFKPDAFQAAFNDSAKVRKTGRTVGAANCEKGPRLVCNYAFTDVIRAAVSTDETGASANEIVITFLRPTHNIKGHSLISYRIYGDLVHLLSPKADEAKRGEAIRKLLAALRTTDKEAVEVGSVRYTLDMKRTGVRFVAKPLAD